MMFDLVISNGTIVTSEATFSADVGIRDGRIAAIFQSPVLRQAQDRSSNHQSPSILDASGCYILPGAIDAHVHLNMPTGAGYTADDWRAGTTAAALGGTTTIIDFVETNAGEHLVDALGKRLAETGEAVVDFGLHMTLQPDEHPIAGVPRRVSEARIRQIRQAYDAGCATFKMYMAYPGFQVQDGDLFRALQAIAAVNGMACIHAENGDVIEVLRQNIEHRTQNTEHRTQNTEHRTQSTEHRVQSTGEAVFGAVSSALWHARTRPSINEYEAATRAVMCAQLSGARILIFHIGCEHAARVVADARLRGLDGVFGETCPHYLVLTEDKLAREDGRRWVCAPPLRPLADQDALWRMLASRALDVVSTDHCPFTLAQKEAGKDDFRKVPGGLPGIETRLGLMHTFGVRAGRLSLNDWVRVCCTRQAELHGLANKGRIAIDCDADLVIFDPALRKELSAGALHSAIDWSAYDGLTCEGWPRDVVSRGEVIVRDQQYVGAARRGRFVKRSFR